MKLKCIGGKCDGQIVTMDDNPRYAQGQAVRIPIYPTIVAFEISPVPVITVNYEFYIVDLLKYAHSRNDISEIWFLRPENFNTFDAIQYQFSK